MVYQARMVNAYKVVRATSDDRLVSASMLEKGWVIEYHLGKTSFPRSPSFIYAFDGSFRREAEDFCLSMWNDFRGGERTFSTFYVLEGTGLAVPEKPTLYTIASLERWWGHSRFIQSSASAPYGTIWLRWFTAERIVYGMVRG